MLGEGFTQGLLRALSKVFVCLCSSILNRDVGRSFENETYITALLSTISIQSLYSSHTMTSSRVSHPKFPTSLSDVV